MGKAWAQGSSTMVRRQLGRRLRALRLAAHKTQEDVAATRLMSLGKLKLIEHGRATVRPGDVFELCQLYGADNATTTDLRTLATATAQDGWWQPYAAGLALGVSTYLDLEASAAALSIYHPSVIHGLLQTREYALLVEQATSLKQETAEAIASRVEVRVQRLPSLLRSETPPSIHVILSETAFQVRLPDEQVMEAQIEHLHEIDATAKVTITVVPHSAGLHHGYLGSFSLLDFDDEEDPSIAYSENYSGLRYDEGTEAVARHREVFEDLVAKSVPLKEFFHER
jgi:transcriptional regulator with XRE-family HTH domain